MVLMAVQRAQLKPAQQSRGSGTGVDYAKPRGPVVTDLSLHQSPVALPSQEQVLIPLPFSLAADHWAPKELSAGLSPSRPFCLRTYAPPQPVAGLIRIPAPHPTHRG